MICARVAKCRQRCWEKDWVIDLDVREFFDSVPWDLMVKAVQAQPTLNAQWTDQGLFVYHNINIGMAVAMTGHTVADGSVVRTVRSSVRLRNDVIVGACPA